MRMIDAQQAEEKPLDGIVRLRVGDCLQDAAEEADEAADGVPSSARTIVFMPSR
jgi:hypothetical protein